MEERETSVDEKVMDGDIVLCQSCGYWVDASQAITTWDDEVPVFTCLECANEEY